MNKEKIHSQNYSEKLLTDEKEIDDTEYNIGEEWFITLSWEGLYNVLVPLRNEGRIKDLKYRVDGEFPDEFIVRFFPTEKIKGIDLFDMEPNTHLSINEEKEKNEWISWDEIDSE